MARFATASWFLALTVLVAGLALSSRVSDRLWLVVLGVAWVLMLVASRISLPRNLPVFNRSLIRTTLTLFTVFAILGAHLVRVQVVESNNTYHRTAEAPNGETISNPRLTGSAFVIDRGEIFDRDGTLIAGTELEDGAYVRYYPDPATSYVAGYFSPTIYGEFGLEATYSEELAGRSGTAPLARFINGLLNRPREGADLHLTLDAGLQRQAMQLLGGTAGSVVVMDVETGAVVVLASNPTFDPNQLFAAGAEQQAAARNYWQSLHAQGNDPLVLRSNLGLYTPGSTFKTITAAIGIELGLIEPDEIFEDNGQLVIDGRVLVERNRPDSSRDLWSVTEALAWSLNVVFAQIGLRIGPEDLWDMAGRFGINASIPFDLPVSRGQVAGSEAALGDDNLLADTAFGQGQIQVTPLFMCMVTAMYVNDGDMMVPYLVDTVVDENGDVSRRTRPEVWRSPVSAQTAAEVEAMMVTAVERGAVSRAAIPGYTVGGKTGTAEIGDGPAHQWFIGFIGEPGGDPRYAVSVVLEQGSGGLGSAVAIGREMLLAAITASPPGP